MKQTITLSNFVDAFQAMDREGNFSYDGKKALFQYLEDYEEDVGEEIELDVIALCCEFTEFTDVEDYADAYGLPYAKCPHCGDTLIESGYKCPECEESTLDQEAIYKYISNHTTFIQIDDDSFIIADY